MRKLSHAYVVFALGFMAYTQSYGELIRLGATDFIDSDSTSYDDLPIVTYTSVTLRADKSVLRSQRHQIDCNSLAHRIQFGKRWSSWETISDSLSNNARVQVCEYWGPERWIFMFEKDNGRFLLDRTTEDSVPKVRLAKRVWIKSENDTAESRIKSIVSRYDFDCSQRRMRTLASYNYNEKGNVLSSYEVSPDSATWSSIIPDSRGEEMSEWVCKTLPKVNRLVPHKKR